MERMRRILVATLAVSLLALAAPAATIDVAARATGGAGTPGSPWTGWDADPDGIPNNGNDAWNPNTTYEFRAGYYSYGTTLDWGQPGIALLGEGTPSWDGTKITGTVLSYTGGANAIEIDAGSLTTDPVIVGIRVENFTIKGNSTADHGIYVRGLASSTFRNVAVTDVALDGLHAEFLLSCVLERFIVNRNTVPMNTRPQHGIWLGQRNAGELSTTNHFIAPSINYVTGTGIYIAVGMNNVFTGGASEYNGDVGIYLDPASSANVFQSLDIENNTNKGIYVGGTGNAFYGCSYIATSPAKAMHFASTYAYEGPTTISGGNVHGDIDIASSARGVTIIGVAHWNNINDSGIDTVLIGNRKMTATTGTADLVKLPPFEGLRVSTSGTAARMGTAYLVAGTVTVSTTAVTNLSHIFLTPQAGPATGTPGWVRVSARAAGTSFTITSSSNTDSSPIGWMIVEP